MKKLSLILLLLVIVVISHHSASADSRAIASIEGIAFFNDDEPKKADVAKEDKGSAVKCASVGCDKSKCASKASASAASCCTSSKSSAAHPGKAACCSKEKVINDSDKK